jgi:hypothetical protein
LGNPRKSEKMMNTSVVSPKAITNSGIDLSKLKEDFLKSNIFNRSINEAIELLTVRRRNPNAVIFIAVIDINRCVDRGGRKRKIYTHSGISM